MAIGLLGRKIGMTQVFNDKGEAVSVTLIEVGPCRVLQLRTKEKDGYEAVQIGFDDKPRRLASRSERGARRARRDDQAYRAYSREEPRRPPGCPAREALLE